MTGVLDRRVDPHDPALAQCFDELSFWSSRFGRLLHDELPLERRIRALDVGCGTGFPLFELAHVHGPTSSFVGVDAWKHALARAAAKKRFYGLDRVHLVRADGARLPFADSSFDLVVSNLGVNNFEDPARAMRECARVARPGARIALTTNTRGHMRELYEAYGRVLDSLHLDDARARLEVEERHRTSSNVLSRLLEDAGWRVQRTVTDEFRLRYADGRALLTHSLTWIGFLDSWRSVVDRPDEPRVFAALERELDRIAGTAGLSMIVPMLYMEGRKP